MTRLILTIIFFSHISYSSCSELNVEKFIYDSPSELFRDFYFNGRKIKNDTNKLSNIYLDRIQKLEDEKMEILEMIEKVARGKPDSIEKLKKIRELLEDNESKASEQLNEFKESYSYVLALVENIMYVRAALQKICGNTERKNDALKKLDEFLNSPKVLDSLYKGKVRIFTYDSSLKDIRSFLSNTDNELNCDYVNSTFNNFNNKWPVLYKKLSK